MPLHFTAFHPDYKMRDAHTPHATLTRARAIAVRHGLRYVYTGNVHDEAGQSTYCHACGAMLIGRDWYRSPPRAIARGRLRLRGGACAGVFDARPGAWGQRRIPVRLGGLAPAI